MKKYKIPELICVFLVLCVIVVVVLLIVSSKKYQTLPDAIPQNTTASAEPVPVPITPCDPNKGDDCKG